MRLKSYVKVYFLVISQYIKARMQYRVDFFTGFAGMIFMNMSGLLGLWVIFQSIPSLQGWSFGELLFMYGFTTLAMCPLQLLFDNIWSLNTHVRTGDFIKYYYRPLNMLFYYITEVFDLKGLGQLTLSIVVVVYSLINLQLAWGPLHYLLFFVMLFSGSVIMISLVLAAASTAFWITNATSLMMTAYNLRDIARYPLSIFNSAFKFFFTFVIPIGFVSYYPMVVLLRPGEVHWLLYFSPLLSLFFFFLAYNVWKRGVQIYNATGS